MKSYFSPITYFALYLLITIVLNGCWSDKNNTLDDTPAKISFQEKNDFPDNLIKKDNVKVTKNFATYTYVVESGNLNLTDAEKSSTDHPSRKKSKEISQENNTLNKVDYRKSEEKVKVESPQITLNLSLQNTDLKTERPPLYGKHCSAATNPVACSEEAIKSFINGNLQFPDTTVDYDRMGTSKLIFRVTKKGAVENIIFQGNADFCIGCVQAAKKFVKSTSGYWIPALQDGQPVNATVTIPLQFTALK